MRQNVQDCLDEGYFDGAGMETITHFMGSLVHFHPFFGPTAHPYTQAICEDLDRRYAGSFSADRSDLLREDGFYASFRGKNESSRL